MNSTELEHLLKDYLETKYQQSLEFFEIEGRMSADTNGDIGVTGNYRKKAGDKKTFFTVTVNLTSRKVTNLQEY